MKKIEKSFRAESKNLCCDSAILNSAKAKRKAGSSVNSFRLTI